jgi:hypothetical protein
MESILGLMAEFMMEAGLITNSMAKELILTKRERQGRENGLKVKDIDGLVRKWE